MSTNEQKWFSNTSVNPIVLDSSDEDEVPEVPSNPQQLTEVVQQEMGAPMDVDIPTAKNQAHETHDQQAMPSFEAVPPAHSLMNNTNITYTREVQLGQWKRYNITLTNSHCVKDLLHAIGEQQKSDCFYLLYLNRESLTTDLTRTIGSLDLKEDDVLVLRCGHYKQPRFVVDDVVAPSPKRHQTGDNLVRLFDMQNRMPVPNSVVDDTNMTTVLARLVNPMGPHFGWLKDGSKLNVHTDQTDTPANMVARMRFLMNSGGATDIHYQTMMCIVEDPKQITPTLLKCHGKGKDARYEFVDIDTYIEYLTWMDIKLSPEDKEKFINARGGKFDWPKAWYSKEFFEEFRVWYSQKTKSECPFRLVIQSPTEGMIPGFTYGQPNCVVVNWLAGSPHKGPGAVNNKIRTNVYTTKSESDGSFTSDHMNSNGVKKSARKESKIGEFWATYTKWRDAICALVQKHWGRPELVNAYLSDSKIADLVKKYQNGEGYNLQCMSGASHAKYLEACMRILRELPTTGAMLAYLYHAPTFEVEQNYNPCVYQEAARQFLPEDDEKHDKVSRVQCLSDIERKVCEEMIKVSLQRMHYYAVKSSRQNHLMKKVPNTVAELLSEEYKAYRMCIYNGKLDKLNVSHGDLAICLSGFGLMGKVHTNPNFELFTRLWNSFYGVE